MHTVIVISSCPPGSLVAPQSGEATPTHAHHYPYVHTLYLCHSLDSRHSIVRLVFSLCGAVLLSSSSSGTHLRVRVSALCHAHPRIFPCLARTYLCVPVLESGSSLFNFYFSLISVSVSLSVLAPFYSLKGKAQSHQSTLALWGCATAHRVALPLLPLACTLAFLLLGERCLPVYCFSFSLSESLLRRFALVWASGCGWVPLSLPCLHSSDLPLPSTLFPCPPLCRLWECVLQRAYLTPAPLISYLISLVALFLSLFPVPLPVFACACA